MQLFGTPNDCLFADHRGGPGAVVLKRGGRKVGAKDKVYKCHSFFRVNREARGGRAKKQPHVSSTTRRREERGF